MLIDKSSTPPILASPVQCRRTSSALFIPQSIPESQSIVQAKERRHDINSTNKRMINCNDFVLLYICFQRLIPHFHQNQAQFLFSVRLALNC
jgi:hypothetical protein